MKKLHEFVGLLQVGVLFERRLARHAALFCSAAILCLGTGCTYQQPAASEQNPPAAQESAPQIYRYDIANATMADPGLTIMLDTATGTVWEMLIAENGGMVGLGKVEMQPAPTVQSIDPGRFRFVPSGGKQTGAFVIDTATGQLWVWGVGENNRSFFASMQVEGLSE